MRHVLMRQGVLGVKVKIMLPYDASVRTPHHHSMASPCRSEHLITSCSRRACPHTVFYILSAGLKLQGKIGPKTKLSDVVTVREPKEEVPDVPAPEVNLAAFPPAPSMPAYSM